MKLPFVSRAIYDELRADYRELLNKYHALRGSGQALPAPKPTPSSTATREHRTKNELVERLASDLARNGVSNAEARREAERLNAMAFGTDGLPE